MKKTYRRQRTFSESLKRDLVKQIDRGELRVCEVSRIYQVSVTSVYNWLRKYSDLYEQQTRIIVEQKSESKKNEVLRKRIAELEQALGKKQMELDYMHKALEIYKEQTGEEVLKKSERRP